MSKQHGNDSKGNLSEEFHEASRVPHSPTSEPRFNDYFHPNIWARCRYLVREPLAEFFGTMLLVLFGNTVNCQVSYLFSIRYTDLINFNLLGCPKSEPRRRFFSTGSMLLVNVYS